MNAAELRTLLAANVLAFLVYIVGCIAWALHHPVLAVVSFTMGSLCGGRWSIAFGQWSSASGAIFVRERIYWRFGWTPLVRWRLRYPLRSFYNGTWPYPLPGDRA